MPYLLGFCIQEENVLAVGENNEFVGTDDLEKALSMLPDYTGKHSLSYTSSMSACIHWMQFSPRLFFFKDLPDIEQSLLDKKIHKAGSIAGTITYANMRKDYVPDLAYVSKLIE